MCTKISLVSQMLIMEECNFICTLAGCGCLYILSVCLRKNMSTSPLIDSCQKCVGNKRSFLNVYTKASENVIWFLDFRFSHLSHCLYCSSFSDSIPASLMLHSEHLSLLLNTLCKLVSQHTWKNGRQCEMKHCFNVNSMAICTKLRRLQHSILIC